MHILILNQTFYPDVAATAQLMWDLALHLDGAGHRVSAVTSRAIYGTDQRLDNPYERIGKIEIHRVTQTAFGKKTTLGRMCDFLSFYASAFVKLQCIDRADVILALTSPPMISAMGMVQRRLSRLVGGRTRLVYHVMDVFPDAAVAMDVMRGGSMIERILGAVTRKTLRSSDAIIALGRDMRDLLVSRHSADPSRIHIVPPWADGQALGFLEKADNPLAGELNVKDTFNIVYSGNFGMAHDADTIASAIERMKGEPGIAWLFIGGGARFNAMKDKAASAGWDNVRFISYIERDKLNLSLNLADVHMVSQLPSFTGIVVPSKLYGIMAVGRPAVMIGPPEAECSRVIADCGCGYVVANGDVDGLVESLLQMNRDRETCQRMGKAGRREFELKYEKNIACARIESILTGATTV